MQAKEIAAPEVHRGVGRAYDVVLGQRGRGREGIADGSHEDAGAPVSVPLAGVAQEVRFTLHSLFVQQVDALASQFLDRVVNRRRGRFHRRPAVVQVVPVHVALPLVDEASHQPVLPHPGGQPFSTVSRDMPLAMKSFTLEVVIGGAPPVAMARRPAAQQRTVHEIINVDHRQSSVPPPPAR